MPFRKQRVPKGIDSHIMGKTQVFRIFDSFQEATKLRIRFIPLRERGPLTLHGDGPLFCKLVQGCSRGKRRCFNEIRRATKMAFKTAEPYIFQCHADLIEIVGALFNGGQNTYALVCGPMLLRHPTSSLSREVLNKVQDLPLEPSLLVRSLQEIPILPERKVQAASDLLFMVANYFAKIDWSSQKQQHEIATQQAQLAEELYHGKKSEKGIKTFLSGNFHTKEDFIKEKELIELIKQGDKRKAKVLLDELLGTVLFRSDEHISILKARMLEIIFIIARAAVEAGANLEEILGFKYHFFQDLSNGDSQENLYYCLLKTFDQLFECIYQNRNIRHTRIFTKLKEFIWANYNQEISLKKLAEFVEINPYYLSHLFRKEMGLSFLEYLTTVRISIAKKLLERTTMTILQICLTVGYQDPSHFAGVFKKYEGIHPSEYRKKILEFESPETTLS